MVGNPYELHSGFQFLNYNKHTQSVSVVTTCQLVLFSEINAVYCENSGNYKQTVWEIFSCFYW